MNDWTVVTEKQRGYRFKRLTHNFTGADQLACYRNSLETRPYSMEAGLFSGKHVTAN